jgi:hypothetical protein
MQWCIDRYAAALLCGSIIYSVAESDRPNVYYVEDAFFRPHPAELLGQDLIDTLGVIAVFV